MKKLIFLGALSALAVGVSATAYSKTASVAKAEGEDISSSVDDSIAGSAERVPASETSEFDLEEWLKDEDGNKIPDKIENYYDDKIRDTYMFGMSLGAVIGLLGTIVMAFWNNSKTSKMVAENIDNKKQIKEVTKKFTEYIELKKKEEEEHKAFVEKQEAILLEFKNENEALRAELREAKNELQQYAKLDDKVNVILANQSLITSTDEYVSNGTAEKVSKNLEAVKNG